jgi:hypothetical protein
MRLYVPSDALQVLQTKPAKVIHITDVDLETDVIAIPRHLDPDLLGSSSSSSSSSSSGE